MTLRPGHFYFFAAFTLILQYYSCYSLRVTLYLGYLLFSVYSTVLSTASCSDSQCPYMVFDR